MNKATTLLLALTIAAHAQVKTSRSTDHGVGYLDSGVTLRYETVIEPAQGNSTVQGLGGGVFSAKGNLMQHALYDRVAAYYFGYAITVLPGDSPATRKVVFSPVDATALHDGLMAVANGLPLNAAPLPKFPPPQIVRSGDAIAMDLMTSIDGRERIVDYIHFSFGGAAPSALNLGPAQDFTIDDGAPQIDLNQAEALIDGKAFNVPVVAYPPKNGKTLWIYVPGEGRFVLSLAPRAGLTKAGAVRGKRITFTWESHEYELRLIGPLAGLEKAWNLYVTRDAAYLPRTAPANVVVMSADRLENLVGK
jgi:hypothetical protein